MKVKFILNPIAGKGKIRKRLSDVIKKVLADGGVEYDIQITGARGEATFMSQEAVKDNFDLVVAVGGDGTINEVASGLVNSNSSLGIIPSGSGNGLALGLGIPLDIEQACKVLFEGKTKNIDVGKIEGRYFFNVAGTGLDARVADQYNKKSKRRGILPYIYIAIKEGVMYKPIETVLRFNDMEMKIMPLLIEIANLKYFGGGAVIAPEAEPDDGLFDVCVMRNIGVIKGLYHAPKLFTGKIAKVSGVEFYRTDMIEIKAEKVFPYQVDGDIIDTVTELKISLLKKALKVIVL